jgi:HTH-type transcriptional regulator/antitoxin HigA
VLLDFRRARAAQKAKYGGELFIASASASPSGTALLEFFQRDKVTGQRKGIIAHRSWRPSMITNERQRRITAAELKRFEHAIAQARKAAPAADVDPRLHRAMIDGMRSQLTDLRRELRAYEKLREGKVKQRVLHSLLDLPAALIEGRIASGLSQRGLGEKLGIAEQQIQRYEQSGYRGVGLERLQEVAGAVGLELTETVRYNVRGSRTERASSPSTRLRRRRAAGSRAGAKPTKRAGDRRAASSGRQTGKRSAAGAGKTATSGTPRNPGKRASGSRSPRSATTTGTKPSSGVAEPRASGRAAAAASTRATSPRSRDARKEG